MKENGKELIIGISVSTISSALILIIGFNMIAQSIENKIFGSSINTPDVIITKDINSKDFLNDYEASEYLGISWEALITLVNNGDYKGNYTKEVNEFNSTYIFPKEELKNWFDKYIIENKTIKADSSQLPNKS